MTTANAFWRLFPAALFTSLGVAWCFFWRFDAVLFAIALCVAALASSWLVLTIIVVAKSLSVASATSPVKGVTLCR